MAKKKKKKMSRRELRSLRLQQLVFVFLGIILILSMVISLVSR